MPPTRNEKKGADNQRPRDMHAARDPATSMLPFFPDHYN
jgi:hypothetical protein